MSYDKKTKVLRSPRGKVYRAENYQGSIAYVGKLGEKALNNLTSFISTLKVGNSLIIDPTKTEFIK